MSGQSGGGVFIAFLGVVLIIAGLNGTLGKTWSALTGGSNTTKAQPSSGTPVPGSIGAGDLPTLTTSTNAGTAGSGITV